MAGPFDDLIPQQQQATNPFADLIPPQPQPESTWRDPDTWQSPFWKSVAGPVSDANAVANRLGTQFTKGVTGLVGLPDTMLQGLQGVGDWGARQLMSDERAAKVKQREQEIAAKPGRGALQDSLFPHWKALPSTQGMNDAIFNDFGVSEVNGQTTAGKILDVGLQTLPAAAAIGPSAAIPAFTGGIGSESAGQLAERLGVPQWVALAARAAGGVAGGVTGAAVQSGGKAVGQGISNTFGRGDPNEIAGKIVNRAINRDNTDPAALAKALDDLGPGGTIADVGGRNVKGTVRAAAGSPGKAAEYVDDALASRKADEPARLGAAIDRVSPNRGFTSTIDDIVEQRSAKAAPLYEQSGIPKDPSQYSSAPRLTSPEVKTLIEKSKDVKAAIAQAKSLPQYADLPDDSIVLLDKAYKNIGGKAEAAKRAGDNVAYRDLNELRLQLRIAIVKERPVYGDALKVYADDSGLKNAIEQGRRLFSSQADAEVIAKTYRALDPDEQILFRQGVAEALRDQAGRSPISPTSRIWGGPKTQAKLKEVLGDDFDAFAKDAGREATFNRTHKDVTVGSRTTPMAAEMSDLSGQVSGAVGDVARGDKLGALLRIGGNVKDRLLQGRNERVNDVLVKMLLNPDAGQQTLKGLLDKKTADELARLLRQQQTMGGIATGPTIGVQQRQ